MRRRFVLLAVVCSGTMAAGAVPPSRAGASPPQSSVAGALSESSASVSAVSGAAVVQYAEKFLGYPYAAVGNSPSTGFSCIGFVSYVYQSLGINLPDDLGGA